MDIDKACRHHVLTSLRQAKFSRTKINHFHKTVDIYVDPFGNLLITPVLLYTMEAGKSARRLGLVKYIARMSDI
jgi:hypothetical protein